MIIKVKTIEEFVNLTKQGKTLVDFFATWCGPCKMLAPILEEADQSKALGDINILEVDVDELDTLASQFGIRAVPTLFLVENGKPIKKTEGYHTLNDLITFVK